MRVIYSGDRKWTDIQSVYDSLQWLIRNNVEKETIVVIEGEAPGLDRMARQEAEELGLVVEKYPANWNKFGRAAGPIRNWQMLTTGADVIMAFHSDIANSHGTKNMINVSIKKGVPVFLHSFIDGKRICKLITEKIP
jgi:hypothetical protein